MTDKNTEPTMATSADFRKGYYAAMARSEKELIAAGYCKQYTIEEGAEDELDSLPPRSVIMDNYGRVFKKFLLVSWLSTGPTLGSDTAYPVTVLYTPKDTQ